ncbi:phosphoheptose isomerase [Nostoc linckia z18]|uniref:Phosphoheptose isomerase n=2 Tax=Nostoc linckia TaxID=92942 RepID=A0A9Q6EKF0_NOSLI|nr:SIS domain-containing protein [Nostoc linckia]PHK35596.1 phosphoheptose isomerase [Nostoc linckia z15]PHK47955.1 phosphoheptose isomerase [Nostoc linckia z16]PHJ62293.1 phosphoheptose isomerase [Nostoc linckia z1]PHJ69685.1 phosphoheptose isomerase [Nostoc linckia z3]PHJ73641.1 phosphoheptose isomerase [Nostoc linckia z2]
MPSVQQQLYSFSTDYFHQLANLGEKFQVTDSQGKSFTNSQGINLAADLINRQHQEQRKVIFIGNGGSATVASHQAIDFWRNGNIPAIAFNDSALVTCISNDFGYEQVFSKPISTFAQSGDILFAISSSGQSENILAGVRQAMEMSCHVITLSAFQPNNPLRQLGHLNFYVPTMSYGFAEIMHLCICHCIIDGLVKGALPSRDANNYLSFHEIQAS